MKVIIGLGNPGAEYQNTRHNAGVMLVDRLASLAGSKLPGGYGWRKFYGIVVDKTPKVILVKSANYFMNESGNVIADVMRLEEVKGKKYELWVAHDDLDIRLGEYKVQKARGPREHGGVNSVEAVFGREFWRVRIGIDSRDVETAKVMEGRDYVLQGFSKAERDRLDGVLDEITARLFE